MRGRLGGIYVLRTWDRRRNLCRTAVGALPGDRPRRGNGWNYFRLNGLRGVHRPRRHALPRNDARIRQGGGLCRGLGSNAGQAPLCHGILCANFRFTRSPFHFSHFVFNHSFQIKSDLSKLSHHFAHGPREARQFFRSKNDEGDYKKKYEMGETEHRGT